MFYVVYHDEETDTNKVIVKEELDEKNIETEKRMIWHLYELYKHASNILSCGNMYKHYNTRYIKKKNGKKRRIDAPDDELREYMDHVRYVFEREFHVIFPENSYAYIKKKTTKDLAKNHLKSSYLCHLDLCDFFNNCTLEFILRTMRKVYPFCFMDIDILETIVKACCLYMDNKYCLPQGAPTSPLLSNIAMIPVDAALSKRIAKQVPGGKYTRYSDDMYISCYYDQYDNMINIPQEVLDYYETGLKLNKEKTTKIDIKKNGAWVLGMRIDDGEIKIGNKNKQQMKAMIWSFLMDYKNEKYWDKQRVQVLSGKIAYYKYLEPAFVLTVIKKYELKTDVKYKEALKYYLHS